MIPAGTARALAAWASGDDSRKQQLLDERDAIVARMLNGGKPTATMTSGNANAKTFAYLPSMTVEEKLRLFTEACDILGLTPCEAQPVTLTYGTFHNLQR